MPSAEVQKSSQDFFDRLAQWEKLLTVRELAEILAISDKTIYSYVARNLIPYYKIQSNVRFRPSDIAIWLRRQGPVSSQFRPSP